MSRLSGAVRLLQMYMKGAVMAQFHQLTVTDVSKTIRDAVVVTLQPDDTEAFVFTQGQYLTFRRDFDGAELRSFPLGPIQICNPATRLRRCPRWEISMRNLPLKHRIIWPLLAVRASRLSCLSCAPQ